MVMVLLACAEPAPTEAQPEAWDFGDMLKKRAKEQYAKLPPADPSYSCDGRVPKASSAAGEGISATIKRNQGTASTCIERSLLVFPELRGRVSVGWKVRAGRVEGAHLVENATEDPQLGQCMVRAVCTMQFDPSLTVDVAEYPWIVGGP